MPAVRCPYFSLQVVEVSIEAPDATVSRLHSKLPAVCMKLSVCRCSLTETLVARLQAHAEGRSLSSYLEGPSIDGVRRPIVGADLQPISSGACTETRCDDHCVPGYIDILGTYGLDTDVPDKPDRPWCPGTGAT
jgi:hypothetical protein